MEVILLQLAVILLAAKIAAEICERLGHNASLGELLAGLVIALLLPGFVTEGSEIIELLASFGIIFMIFMVGLESRLEDLELVEKPAFSAALGGTLLPFVLGFTAVLYFGFGVVEALFVATALTASSIGVTAKVFMGLGKIRSRAAEIILGAAVIDDVLSLLLLAIVMGATVMGSSFIGEALAVGAFFWFVFVPLGWFVVPKIMDLAHNMRSEGSILVISLVLLFLFTYVAEVAGFAAVVGAFIIGLIMTRTRDIGALTKNMYPLYYFMTPIFFVSIGMMFDPYLFGSVFGLGIAITLAAVVGKVLGCAVGCIIAKEEKDALIVGVGMMPRGEVALIIVSLAMATGLIDRALYSATIFMAVVTIFITPIILNILYKHKEQETELTGG
ncbi:MAG: cation:proton antiporter [Candidatus Altiarchaeota archaeon]